MPSAIRLLYRKSNSDRYRVQVRFRNVLIDAVNPALENAEIGFDGIGGDDVGLGIGEADNGGIANVFLVGVVDRSVRSEVVADIGVNRCARRSSGCCPWRYFLQGCCAACWRG